MPDAPSTRLGIITPSDAGDALNQLPNVLQAIRDLLDPKLVVFDQGLAASRPVATAPSPGIKGHFYYSTDTGALDYDFGTGWLPLALGTDPRFPAGVDIVNSDISATAAIVESKLSLASDAAVGTPSRRTLGPGALQAAPGNDSRFPAGADIVLGDLATALQAFLVPSGAIMAWPGPSNSVAPPTGWQFCYGQVLLRASYPAMFAALGASSAWGLPDGTHFTVPDLRGRTIFGDDDMGGSNAGRLPVGPRDTGGVGGEETHVLTVAELASHSHGLRGDPTNTNDSRGAAFAQPNTTTGSGTPSNSNNPVQSAGSSTAHNNMPPFAVMNWIIKE